MGISLILWMLKAHRLLSILPNHLDLLKEFPANFIFVVLQHSPDKSVSPFCELLLLIVFEIFICCIFKWIFLDCLIPCFTRSWHDFLNVTAVSVVRLIAMDALYDILRSLQWFAGHICTVRCLINRSRPLPLQLRASQARLQLGPSLSKARLKHVLSERRQVPRCWMTLWHAGGLSRQMSSKWVLCSWH